MYSKPQFTELTYIGGTGPCGPMTVIFGSAIQSQHTSLNIKFGVNRTFDLLKTPVYRFDSYRRYQILWTDDDNFCSVIQSQYTSLNINFGVNRTFPVLKTPVYRIDLRQRHRTLWTDDCNFWQCYLELVYTLKCQIWCESDVPCAQDPSLPI